MKDLPTKQTWLSPYWDIWQAQYGAQPTALAGQLAKILRPLVNAHGPEQTQAQFAHYLHATKVQYVNLAKFSASFGSWGQHGHQRPADANRPQPKPLGPPPTEKPMTLADWQAEVAMMRTELERIDKGNAFRPRLARLLQDAEANVERMAVGLPAKPLRLR